MTDCQRYRIPLLKGTIFERRPIAEAPPFDDLFGFLDAGTLDNTATAVAARYRGGEWKALGRAPKGFVPTFWTMTVDELA